jgi:hypothetical protein
MKRGQAPPSEAEPVPLAVPTHHLLLTTSYFLLSSTYGATFT